MITCSAKIFLLVATASLLLQGASSLSFAQVTDTNNYLLLASKRTSTMQKEMQEAADQGYVFAGVMGGETSFGGNEVVVVMKQSSTEHGRYEYRLLATQKTSTMQQEMQEAGDAGYIYKGQTVFGTTFGGDELQNLHDQGSRIGTKPGRYASNKESVDQFTRDMVMA